MTVDFDVFVSYSTKDDRDGWVTAFVEALQAEHRRAALQPLAVFLDHEAIPALADWEHRIVTGLRHSKVLLAVLSPAYFASEWCRREWEQFCAQELDRAGVGESLAPIYAVSVPGFEDRGAPLLDAWQADLRRRQHLDVRPWRPEGPAALQRDEVRQLIQRLDQDLDLQLRRAARRAAGPSTIPPHNPQFVGRLEELRRLHRALSEGRVGAITAVHGLGGIGKSALAFEYAHAFADHYPGGRFLVPCAGTSDLRLPLVNLAELKGVVLTEAERKDLAAASARVRAAFEQGERSLLVLDNVDAAALLSPAQRAECLPSSDQVHVLVTTRLEPAKLPGLDCLALEALTDDEAVALLDRWRPVADDAERAAARGIAQWLDGYTLAVEVVAVYLAQHAEISAAGYLHRLEREGEPALEGIAADDTVQLSRHQQKLIGELLAPTLAGLSGPERLALEYAAFVAPDWVPWPWLRELVGRDDPEVLREPEPGYPDPWRQVERRLAGLRLLVPREDERLARVHRLVQAVVAGRVGAAAEARRAAVLDHAQARADWLNRDGWVAPEARWEIEPCVELALALLVAGDTARGGVIANAASWPLCLLGRLDEAVAHLRTALAHEEAAPGLAQTQVAETCNHLATVEQDLGHLAEARGLLRRAIAIGEQAFAPDHPTLATRYSNLALVEQDLGHLAEARELLHRAIAIDELAFAPDRPKLAIRYSNLATVEQDLGHLTEARDLLCRTIAIKGQAYAPEHPTMAASYSNLAKVERDLGHLAEARELMDRCIAIERAAFGGDHYNLAIDDAVVASIDHAEGHLDEAEQLLRRTIATFELHFAEDNRRLLDARFALAKVLFDQGRAAEALPLVRRVFTLRREHFGLEHFETQKIVTWLREHDAAWLDEELGAS